MGRCRPYLRMISDYGCYGYHTMAVSRRSASTAAAGCVVEDMGTKAKRVRLRGRAQTTSTTQARTMHCQFSSIVTTSSDIAFAMMSRISRAARRTRLPSLRTGTNGPNGPCPNRHAPTSMQHAACTTLHSPRRRDELGSTTTRTVLLASTREQMSDLLVETSEETKESE